MRRALFLLAALVPAGALLAGGQRTPLEAARDEVAAAQARQERLEAAASKARGAAGELRARQLSAAAAIGLAEARIAAADLALASAESRRQAALARLSRARAPAAALVAGVVTMGRRPPLLLLADGGSVDELVRLRALLDTGLPAIRARSAAIAREAEVAASRAGEVRRSRLAIAEEQQGLAAAQARFATLEREAETRAASLSGESFLAADRVIAGGETVGALGRADERAGLARRGAAVLSRLEPLPPRPGAPDPTRRAAPFAYRLPVDAAVTEGLGEVSEIGIAARGLTFSSFRGQKIAVPADAKVLFAGPYRRFDGIVILDHGGGWTSLITHVRPDVATGDKVRLGDPLGSALGATGLELRQDRRPVSPALIARSSVSLSNAGPTR